jgi:hypothetical protein
MKPRLLFISCLLLFFACFSYLDEEVAAESGVGLNSTLLYFRVLPMCGVLLLSWFSAERGTHFLSLREMFRPPYCLWLWYIAIATLSGFISDIQPIWSAWKCFEVFVVVFWGARLSSHLRMTQNAQTLKQCFVALFAASYLIVAWSLYSFTEGSPEVLFSALVDPVVRLSSTWPHINPISLSVISIYTLAMLFILFRGKKVIVIGALALIPATAAVMTRSRTGLLVLVLILVYLLTVKNLSIPKRVGVFALMSGVVAVILSVPALRDAMRLDHINTITAAGGRISSGSSEGSAWSESAEFIAEAPVFGRGFLNAKRFLIGKSMPVDNVALQAILSAGFVGAIPMLIYLIVISVAWFRTARRVSGLVPLMSQLTSFGIVGISLALGKGLTTNELSNHGFALILLILSVETLTMLKRTNLAKQPAVQAEPVFVYSDQTDRGIIRAF